VAALGAEAVTGIAMPSEFSSEHSVADARALAENLGIEFHVLPIARVYERFLETLDPLFRGTAFGVAEENIQARVRGNLLMAISNKFGWIVLTTGNKSELAVGYCTLYGDMSGGLAVISDLLKTRVYALSRWVNRDGERIPASTIEKPPSAELRPGQLDSDSLPPYEILDPIVEAYVERHLHTRDIIAEGGDEETVQRIVRMIDLNEYKRQQAAPGLKITSRAFGVGRRMPIARGDWA
jgi:NAD+ synthase (glutamine-hydrolysing)